MGSERIIQDQARKKIRPTTRETSWALFYLRCVQLGLSDDALAEMTMGMVYEMLTERGNDQLSYPYKATQEDIETFFPAGR